jgi:hypothetical protein
MKHWKFFRLKNKEFRNDKITNQFVDYEKAFYVMDDPLHPLLVLESNDNLNFFDVNAKTLQFVHCDHYYQETVRKQHTDS